MAKDTKERILMAALDMFSKKGFAYYGERFGSAEHLPPVPDSLEDFVSMTMRMVNLTIHDEQIVKTKRMTPPCWPLPTRHRSPHLFTCATGSRRKQRMRLGRSKHSAGILSKYMEKDNWQE